VRETGRFAFIFCAAACSEGRIPSATSHISSTTVENSSSRVYGVAVLLENLVHPRRGQVSFFV
jgi:hypothetical protein